MIFIILFTLLFFFLSRTKIRLKILSPLYIISLVIIIVLNIWNGQALGANFIFIFTIPPASILLLGIKPGIIITFVTGAILSLQLYIPELSKFDYHPDFALRVIFGYFIIALQLIIIELVKNKKNQQTEKLKKENLINSWLPDKKALAVDDNPVNLYVAVKLLEPTGMHIDTAASGPESIELAKNNKYDIIFMDHMMPEMDGIEALKEIRKISGYMQVPIIALTANTVNGMKEFYLKQGFNGYLSKPLDEQELDQTINDFLVANSKNKRQVLPENPKSIIKTEIEAQKIDKQKHLLFSYKIRIKNALLEGDVKAAETLIAEMGELSLDRQGQQLYLKLYHYMLTGETEKLLEYCND